MGWIRNHSIMVWKIPSYLAGGLNFPQGLEKEILRPYNGKNVRLELVDEGW